VRARIFPVSTDCLIAAVAVWSLFAACGSSHPSGTSSDGGPGGSGGAGSLGADGSAVADAGPPFATVGVDTSHPATPIPDTFLGISTEWSSVVKYLGDGSGNANPVVIRLLAAFGAEGNHPTIRIGGNSADQAWWNPSGTTPRPTNVTIDVGAAHVSTLASLNAMLGTTLIPDLDLALQGTYADAVTNAASLAQAILAAVPPRSVRAFEIGNEPDLWYKNGLRAASYTFSGWQSDYDAFTAGLDAVLSPPPPYAAPALSGKSWLPNLDGLYAAEKANLALATAHRYPFDVCNGKAAPAVSALLADAANQNAVTMFASHIQVARAADVDFRVAELNSVACGGADGVSNVYAAALWGADVAFQLAWAGAVGVNFHTPGSYYAVYTLSSGVLTVEPLYYGMRFFSLAVPGGAAPVTTTITPSTSTLHAWASVGTDGKTRLALLSLDAATGGTVALQIPSASRATLTRLHAAAVDAKSGLKLGGQTWDGSTDGTPQGTAVTEPVPLAQGIATVALPPLDAVILTID
jgi:Glycosyl hydrolase family 79 C-terminal beta domain